MLILPRQSKMARAALDWSVKDLAKAAGVGTTTISRLESGDNVTVATLRKIQTAFEKAGIEFIPDVGGGPGVRLKG